MAIRSMDLGSQQAGMLVLQWDGTTDSGAAAANGQYSFSVDAIQGGQKVGATALAFGQVASVANSGQGVVLNVPSLGPVNLADIRQIL
jgi:flagellar basal-body rod modification protein FlgD